jgi:hypothetical protein
VLLPAFEAKHGVKVHVISVGTGKALELGKNGDVDVVLVHARAAEDKFVADGHGVNRRDVMYNDFILVGDAGGSAGAARHARCHRRLPQAGRGPRQVHLARRQLRHGPDGESLLEGGGRRAEGAPGSSRPALAWARC